jgi:hypothetical protein
MSESFNRNIKANNNWKVLKLPVLIDRLSDMEQDQRFLCPGFRATLFTMGTVKIPSVYVTDTELFDLNPLFMLIPRCQVIFEIAVKLFKVLSSHRSSIKKHFETGQEPTVVIPVSNHSAISCLTRHIVENTRQN